MKKAIILKLGLLIKITQSTRKFIIGMDENDPLFEEKVRAVMVTHNEKCLKIGEGKEE